METPEVTDYLKAIQNDILDNLEQFVRRGGDEPSGAIAISDAVDERRPTTKNMR